MKIFLLIFNKALLFACISMYFGTGWSLVLFSFPIASNLTPQNYYNVFVPQVTLATHFFTYMTIVMLLCCTIFIIEKWRCKAKWYPIGILFLIIVATFLTTSYIFPYNEQMASGINDPNVLQDVLSKWMHLNILRVLLWTLQWFIMMIYFSLDCYYTKKFSS